MRRKSNRLIPSLSFRQTTNHSGTIMAMNEDSDRPALRQHDPHAVDRRRAESEFPAIPGLPLGAAPMAYVLWQRAI